ncbi:thiamine diphosphokinase [Cyclonatronum proteinivorum]|uniref:Thiamine diphosphokinase n=1 Tax=Cyclonatronum proteinivorum TaxID=1457365 RepID=A0A345UFU6_9BACT|nr:thiamine diphosphokinase [Cyclonatronum proteinivorum]AXI99347.1 thiamine diphosphokinase [Cyclonatronum proteinivorum]
MNILICGNGQPPSLPLLHKLKHWSDKVIAADGGAFTLRDAQIKPDYIIGDMDSFNPLQDVVEAGSTLLRMGDQETNDLEKALMLSRNLQAKEVVIAGGTGYRLDHTLKNLSCMQRFNPDFEHLLLLDDYCITFVLPPEFSFRTKPGTIVSLFPLTGRVEGIHTSGLKFSLSGEALENGVRDGSSNEAVAEKVTIRHESGTLLLMLPSQWPLKL